MNQATKGGNLYDKYNTKNAVAAYLMGGYLRAFDKLASNLAIGRAVEVGCGEGELIRRFSLRGWKTSAFDVSAEVIEEAKRRDTLANVHTRYTAADIETADLEAADLLVCCEVLEHLEHPRQALQKMARASPTALFSVPNEPLWRILNMVRGAYLTDFGNTPGHLQHWSRAGFVAMLSCEFDVVEVRNPMPWTMVLCRSRQLA